jgi:hypothetical protein
MQTLTNANLEKLSTSLDAHNRANVQQRLAPDCIVTANASIRAFNVLLDLCLSLGMDHDDEPDLWAAGRVGRWLRAA